MNRTTRAPRTRISVLASAVITVLALAPPASADPPANDEIESATRVTAVPARFVQDTGGATASSTDGPCVFGDSVWYRYRPAETRRVRWVTIGSDYDTVLAVFRGPRRDRTLVGCNDDAVFFDSAVAVRHVAGEKYWVAVSACCSLRSRGGELELNAYAPAPAGVTSTVATVATGAVSGRLFVDGTIACDTLAGAYLEVTASQRVGENVAHGEGFGLVDPCRPEGGEWSVALDSTTGWAFQPGLVSLTVSVQAFDGFNFVEQGPDTANYPVVEDPDRIAPVPAAPAGKQWFGSRKLR